MHSDLVTKPFDFSRKMSLLIDDISRRVEEFSTIRSDQLAVAVSQTRNNEMHGIQAKVTPLRFAGGHITQEVGGRVWGLERLFDSRTNQEILYVITFYLPRFQNQSFEEKIITVFHELFHIDPKFNGDIRRFSGRYHLHSKSQKEFDNEMSRLANRYLSLNPAPETYRFLELSFHALQKRHNHVVGLKIATPKIVPLSENAAA